LIEISFLRSRRDKNTEREKRERERKRSTKKKKKKAHARFVFARRVCRLVLFFIIIRKIATRRTRRWTDYPKRERFRSVFFFFFFFFFIR